MKEKRQYKLTNSVAVAASALWYPFTETGAPSDLDRDQYFPLKSFTMENKSSQEIVVILDPVGNGSSKEFQVPDGKTLSLENRDLISFHQVVIQNDGDLEIPILQLKITMRNY